MMKLIFTELKKIWKNKGNIMLLMFLMGYTAFMSYQTYHDQSVANHGKDWTLNDVNGNTIDLGLSYYRIADQILHQYQGTADALLYDTYVKDFQAIMDQYPQKDYDDAYMNMYYGEQYEQFLEDCTNALVSEDAFYQRIRENMEKHGKNSYHIESLVGEDGVLHPGVYYENDHVRALYQMIYGQGTAVFSLYGTDQNINIMEEMMSDMHQLCTDSKTKLILNSNVDSNSALANNLKEAFDGKDRNPSFDSTVGNNLFMNALGHIDYVTLLVLAMILANTFAMEVYYKTDQILIPSKTTMKRLTIAKICAGILLGILVLALEYGIVYGFAMYFVPLRDLGMHTMNQARTNLSFDGSNVFTYWQILTGGILLHVMAVTATCMVTMALSFFTKSRFVSVIPVLILLFLTTTFTPIKDLTGSFFDHIFMGNMMKTMDFFILSGDSQNPLPYVMLFGHLVSCKLIIVFCWTVICVLFGFMMVHHSKKHVVWNH